MQYYKNANKYCTDNNLPNYIGEVINKNGIYKGKRYHRITKEEYQANMHIFHASKVETTP